MKSEIYYTIVNRNNLPIGFCIKTHPCVYAYPLFNENQKDEALKFLKSIKPDTNKLVKIRMEIYKDER